ncbi:MAG: hypothetical protein ABIY70_10585 [Capsulimonas sp.]|uniref:hypothetical protein n=1 Tax=Capsulimonas sp. TaxID=2494211 RepID=UPI00326472AB
MKPISPSFYAELTPLSADALLTLFDANLDEASGAVDMERLSACGYDPEARVSWLSEVAHQFVQVNQGNAQPLLDRLGAADAEHAAQIIGALLRSDIAHPKLYNLLLAYITDPRARVAAAAIRYAYLRGYPKLRDVVIDQWNAAPSVPVVCAALDYLSKIDPNFAGPRILAALETATDIHILQSAIDNADEMGLTKAMPMLKKLQHHPHEYVRQAADYAVSTLRTTKPSKGNSS